MDKEARIYNSFKGIYDKVINDGYLSSILKLFSQIFSNEIKYAIKCIFSRINRVFRK